MEEKIRQAIYNAAHYLEGEKFPYVTDYATYVACPNPAFLNAIKLELGGEINYAEEVSNYFLDFEK